MKWLVALIGLSLVLPASALTVYKGRDRNGNIILSDSPFPGGTPMEVQGVQTMPLPKVKEGHRKATEESEEAVGKYTVGIAAPTEGQVFRKGEVEAISVGVSVSPEPRSGHRVVVLVDGRPVAEDAEAVSVNMADLERGSHAVTAQVKDASGKVLGSAQAVTFQVDQATLYDRAKPSAGTPAVPVAPLAPQAPKAFK